MPACHAGRRKSSGHIPRNRRSYSKNICSCTYGISVENSRFAPHPVMSGSRIARAKLQELLGILHCAQTGVTHRAASMYISIALCTAVAIYLNASCRESTSSMSEAIYVLSKVVEGRTNMPYADRRRPGRLKIHSPYNVQLEIGPAEAGCWRSVS